MLNRTIDFVQAILANISRFIVRLFVNELKVGVRNTLFGGTTQEFLNSFRATEKFVGIAKLAEIAKEYGIPVHIYYWYRHEEGVRHSYFVPSHIYIYPNSTKEELERIRKIIGERKTPRPAQMIVNA